MLVFDVELMEMEEGLPEGYMFIWKEEVGGDLFTEMDTDKNEQVEPSEVCSPKAAILFLKQPFF